MKMLVVLIFYVLYELATHLDCGYCHAFCCDPYPYFSTKIQSGFRKRVRTQISNMNTFIQEKVTGMKIVQLLPEKMWKLKKFE
jgi:hypothetical protein